MSDTLAHETQFELLIKHSRFIALAAPVETPAQAMAFLQRVAEPAATHNCWAYRIGEEYRSSDDGEPSGTAGRPILAAIDGQGYDRVVVVVTRWYGGIKLGAGGLVRAYGSTAAECLRTATRRALVELYKLEVSCPFEDLGVVHTALASFGADKHSEDFDTDGARLRLTIPADQVGSMIQYLRDATRDRARCHVHPG